MALSLHLWCKNGDSNIHVWFGDNDSVRYALIRASGPGGVAVSLLRLNLKDEANRNSLIWFARVPTEADISDFLRGLKCNCISAMKWQEKSYTKFVMKFMWRCEIFMGEARFHIPKNKKGVCCSRPNGT